MREMSKTSWLTGKTHYERRFGEPLKGPIIPIGALVEYLPNSERDKAKINQFGKKVLPGIFVGCALIVGGIWKGDILIADIEELVMLDAPEIHPRRLNAREVLITQKTENLCFLWQMAQQNFQEKTTNSKNPL